MTYIKPILQKKNILSCYCPNGWPNLLCYVPFSFCFTLIKKSSPTICYCVVLRIWNTLLLLQNTDVMGHNCFCSISECSLFIRQVLSNLHWIINNPLPFFLNFDKNICICGVSFMINLVHSLEKHRITNINNGLKHLKQNF